MHLYEIIWKDRFADKMAEKHDIGTDEVEDGYSRSRTSGSQKRDR